MTYVGIAHGLFSFSILAMTIAFVVRWVRSFSEVWRYRYFGLAVIGFSLLTEGAMLLLIPNVFEMTSVTQVVIIDAINFFKLFCAAIVGLYFVEKLNQTPVFSGELGDFTRRPILELLIRDQRGWLLAVLAMVLGMIVFSVLLFVLADAIISERLLEKLNLDSEGRRVTFVVVLALAFSEEIMFRLGLQNWLAYVWGNTNKSYWWAIIVTTTFWTLGHAGVMQPEWVKFVQIFVFGLLLGLLNRRYGILACIAVHGIFNVAMVPIGKLLLFP